MIDEFEKVNYLLGHFCRQTGFNPTGLVTNCATEFYSMLQTGTTCWELHRMIDTYSCNQPGKPAALFEDFYNEFWHGDQQAGPGPWGNVRSLVELVTTA